MCVNETLCASDSPSWRALAITSWTTSLRRKGVEVLDLFSVLLDMMVIVQVKLQSELISMRHEVS